MIIWIDWCKNKKKSYKNLINYKVILKNILIIE